MIMYDIGMTIPSIHCGIDVSPGVTEEDVAEKLLKIHEEFGIDTFVTSGLFDTAEEARILGERIAKVLPILQEHGCRFLFHNHNDELHRGEGCGDKRAMDIILEYAAHDLQLQIDFGWAGFEEDELLIAEEYRDKVCAIHLKDFYSEYIGKGYTRQQLPRESFAPIGEGVIRLEEVLKKIPEFPAFCGTMIIDQDHYHGDMLQALKTGLDNVRSWGYEIDKE